MRVCVCVYVSVMIGGGKDATGIYWVKTSRLVSAKDSTCQYRRRARHRFDSWVGKIPPKEEMATHPSMFAREIPWREEPGGLHSPWGPKQSSMTKHTRWVLLISQQCTGQTPQHRIIWPRRSTVSRLRNHELDTLG